MERVQELISGSGAFALCFVASLVLLAVFATLYSAMTAHREMTMIRSGNKAAALSLGGGAVFGDLDHAPSGHHPDHLAPIGCRRHIAGIGAQVCSDQRARFAVIFDDKNVRC